MEQLRLFMLLLGSTPKGRNIEQHDIFFSIGTSLKDLIPGILDFWPDGGTLHIDAWREVTEVDGFRVNILPKENSNIIIDPPEQLFFLNLGGYKPGEFEEFHYKMLAVSREKGEAVSKAKQSAFYKHTGFKGATSHVDDKFGIDVDDIYQIKDILPKKIKEKYSLQITFDPGLQKDEWHLGYIILSKLMN